MTPSLDGRRFALVSSTASRVDPTDPTVFDYHEQGGLLWGEYAGGTVAVGRFTGTRDGDRIEVRFAHLPAGGGAPVTGAAESRVERSGDGLRLVEEFEADGRPQTSVCEERR